MRIEKWKQWWQVRDNGYTVAQFLTRREAETFRLLHHSLPAADERLGEESVGRKAVTVRKINIYP